MKVMPASRVIREVPCRAFIYTPFIPVFSRPAYQWIMIIFIIRKSILAVYAYALHVPRIIRVADSLSIDAVCCFLFPVAAGIEPIYVIIKASSPLVRLAVAYVNRAAGLSLEEISVAIFLGCYTAQAVQV